MTKHRNITLGQAIRIVREQAGETQQDMADVLDVDRAHISMLENDKRVPSVALARAIHHYYGFDIFLLVALSGKWKNVTQHRMLLGLTEDDE